MLNKIFRPSPFHTKLLASTLAGVVLGAFINPLIGVFIWGLLCSGATALQLNKQEPLELPSDRTDPSYPTIAKQIEAYNLGVDSALSTRAYLLSYLSIPAWRHWTYYEQGLSETLENQMIHKP